MTIIGNKVVSKATDASGIITDIDKKYLYVSFTYSGTIKVPLKNYETLLLIDNEIKSEINNHIESTKRKRTKTEGFSQQEQQVF